MNQTAFTIDEWCTANRMCRATFYNLMKSGKGPVIMKVGSKTLISVEAAEAWRRQREAGNHERREETMKANVSKACETCACAQRLHSGEWHCRRHAPVVILAGSCAGECVWPLVGPTSWCAEWERRK